MTRHRMLWLACLLAAGLVSTPLQAQKVYRVVGSAGNVTFTDNPDSGGSEVTLEPLQGVSTMAPKAPAAAVKTKAAAGSPFMPYDRFVVMQPMNATVLAPEPFSVEIDVSPALRDDHKIRLLVDGNLSQSALHGQAFWVPALAVGEHQLQAELLDRQERVRHRTPSHRVRIVPKE